jgi:hypothetical protein
MGFGVSIVLIAVGAILRWAVTTTVSGFSIHTVGLILLVIGVIGLIVSVVLWSSMGGWYPGRVRRTNVVERRGVYDDRDRDDRAA